MPGPKLNNRCIYPGANHQPRHKAKFRVDEAKERQAEYDKLSLQQKLDKLPPNGAKKQRARLEAALAAKQQKDGETAPIVAKTNVQKKNKKEGK